MAITTFSSREFNQDASKAKQAATDGPVIITDRGRPSHVLMTFAAYKKLTSKRVNIADLLSMPGVAGIELPLAKAKDLVRPADFD